MSNIYLQRRLGNICDTSGNCDNHLKGNADILHIRDVADDWGSANARRTGDKTGK